MEKNRINYRLIILLLIFIFTFFNIKGNHTNLKAEAPACWDVLKVSPYQEQCWMNPPDGQLKCKCWVHEGCNYCEAYGGSCNI